MILNVFSQGSMLLMVGMITVFFILFLVVLFGNLIIRFVNKFLPAALPVVKGGGNSGKVIDNKIMAVLAAAVNEITGGKGKITNVEKL